MKDFLIAWSVFFAAILCGVAIVSYAMFGLFFVANQLPKPYDIAFVFGVVALVVSFVGALSYKGKKDD